MVGVNGNGKQHDCCYFLIFQIYLMV